jgi:Zn-finger nucleic acid-binding protein
MNCRNCAAPMELFDRRRYYFCKYCGTFEFIEGSGGDGIQVLERRGDAPCPLCAAPLAKSLLDETHPVQYCEKCRGILIERSAFAHAVQQRRARATGPGTAPAAIDRREFERRVTCPTCQTRMEVHPYYGPGNVVIDTCRKCDLVWLDFGELRQIDEAPGDDRGRPPRVTTASVAPEARLSDDRWLDRASNLDAGAMAVGLLFDIFN